MTRNSMVASGNRFALATLRFAAVLGCQLAIDAIFMLASKLFAHAIDEDVKEVRLGAAGCGFELCCGSSSGAKGTSSSSLLSRLWPLFDLCLRKERPHSEKPQTRWPRRREGRLNPHESQRARVWVP